jgi:hypothetical protein
MPLLLSPCEFMPRSFVLLLLSLAALLPAADPLRLDPSFLRLDLQPQQIQIVTLTLTAPPGASISHVAVDCACLHVESPLPAVTDSTGRWDLRLRVTGMRPGVEDIQVATSLGIARAQLQIVGPGAGKGRDQLVLALNTAQQRNWSVWAVGHDLKGSIRHCACSTGSLGGIDRLAALPGLAGQLSSGVNTRWILSGDADGKRPGVATALAASGWTTLMPEIRVSADPMPLLAQPGIVAIIPTVPLSVQHRRLLRPVLTGGLAVELLLVDAQGQVQEHRTMPVDDSLPSHAAIVAGFPDRLTSTIDATAQPAAACATCHASAVAAWSRSRHARALDSLAVGDRTDGCIGCHTTATAERVLAPAVSCQACHSGSGLHIASGGTIRTGGAVDCRGCHDAQHHPTFQREAGWKLVEHGREAAGPGQPGRPCNWCSTCSSLVTPGPLVSTPASIAMQLAINDLRCKHLMDQAL